MKSLHELFGNLLYSAFRKSLVVLQNVEQLALGVLGDNTELSICLKSIEHKNDILVVQFPENSNLLAEIADVFLTFAMLGDKLHRHCEARVLPPCLHSTDSY
jgi:hypothetical protein